MVGAVRELASARLSCEPAVAMTVAPIAFPTSTAARPTPPAAPCTSSVSPSRSPARYSSPTCAVPYATMNPAAVS